VKDQNWFAVGLDLFIVVLGVFIGIQVSNWNLQRIENTRAETYLERLHRDLSTDIVTLKSRLSFWGAVIDEGEVAITYAETGEQGDKSDWDMIVAFYQASQIWKYNATATTYQELKASGELGLIRDDGLRGEVAAYYENLDRRASDLYGFNPEYRTIIRAMTPYPAQSYIWNNCHEGDGYNQILLACPEPGLNIDMTKTLESIATDPEIVGSLRFWMTNLRVTQNQGTYEIARLQELATFVDDVRRAQ
jgi:hypothetical protein